MRRCAIRLVLLVLLFIAGGAIVNVAVAWGCVWFMSWPPQPLVAVKPPDLRWVEANRKTNDPIGRHHVARSRGVVTDGYCTPRGTYSRVLVKRHRAGWPRLSLEGGSWDVIAEPALKPWGETARVIAIDAIPIFRGPDPDDVTPLPVRPLWPGFAINTIFYAAIPWIVFACPGVVKRIRRRRRGQCVHCGYDLRGQPAAAHGQSTKCPECGRSA